jgi:PTH2 family peptidyl-tRNA hydrolase
VILGKKNIRKMKTKQVIVFRKDLQVRKGKFAAQVAHASFKVFLDLCEKGVIFDDEQGEMQKFTFYYKAGTPWDKWLNGLFTKIVVSCENEKELDELYQKAKDKNLPCSMIVDAGLTEFNGVPTKTCIAIGPANSDDIDEITKDLKLL